MGDIGPYGGISHGDVLDIAVPIPAVVIDGDAIVGISHKDSFDENISATKYIDSVAPLAGAYGFKVSNSHIV